MFTFFTEQDIQIKYQLPTNSPGEAVEAEIIILWRKKQFNKTIRDFWSNLYLSNSSLVIIKGFLGFPQHSKLSGASPSLTPSNCLPWSAPPPPTSRSTPSPTPTSSSSSPLVALLTSGWNVRRSAAVPPNLKFSSQVDVKPVIPIFHRTLLVYPVKPVHLRYAGPSPFASAINWGLEKLSGQKPLAMTPESMAKERKEGEVVAMAGSLDRLSLVFLPSTMRPAVMQRITMRRGRSGSTRVIVARSFLSGRQRSGWLAWQTNRSLCLLVLS